MPLAATCKCIRRLVFSDDPNMCQNCGHTVAQIASASTMEIALAIAEVALSQRRVGDVKAGNTIRTLPQP